MLGTKATAPLNRPQLSPLLSPLSRFEGPLVQSSRPFPRLLLLSLPLAFSTLVACTPRVSVEAPKEPITINLNVKIDHEVRVKVEKDLEEVISEDSDLF